MEAKGVVVKKYELPDTYFDRILIKSSGENKRDPVQTQKIGDQ